MEAIVAPNTAVVSFGGSLKYQGALNGFGMNYTQFTVMATDIHGDSSYSNVSINVINVDDPPVALTKAISILEDQPVIVDLLECTRDIETGETMSFEV